MRPRTIALDPQPPSLTHCPNCDCEMALHQPDIDLPDRLLGTCMACKSWFLLDETRHIRLALPSGNDLCVAARDQPRTS
jgi:hypothetical protein